MSARLQRLGAVAVAVAAVLLSSCSGAKRSTIDMRPTYSEGDPPRAFAMITQVRDARRFEERPLDPSVPSLWDAEELKNPAITSRAIARKRDGWGMALGDVLLPEGRTVEQVVREAVTKALREKGYAVVDERSADREQALPLEVTIQQFWSWASPGIPLMSAEFEGILVMRSSALLNNEEELVRGHARIRAFGIGDGQWLIVMRQGLDDLALRVRGRIRDPEAIKR